MPIILLGIIVPMDFRCKPLSIRTIIMLIAVFVSCYMHSLANAAAPFCYISWEPKVFGAACLSPAEHQQICADHYSAELKKNFTPYGFDFFGPLIFNANVISDGDIRACGAHTESKCSGGINAVGECNDGVNEYTRKKVGNPNPQSICQAGEGSAYLQGNPVNVANGNKYEVQIDYSDGSQKLDGLAIKSYYNGMTGLWTNDFSLRLINNLNSVTIVHSDGRQSLFRFQEGSAFPEPTELGALKKQGDQWVYDSVDQQRYSFDANGRLLRHEYPSGVKELFSYGGGSVQVVNSYGQTLTAILNSNHGLVQISGDSSIVYYEYDSQGRLFTVSRHYSGDIYSKIYHYEDIRNAKLLTGITNELGVRVASWEYDAQGRAVSSEHAGGAGRIDISYPTDDVSVVTNALGKQIKYHYVIIDGAKRISSIEGEPTPDCPASNSTYTYNERGQVLTKTDAKGLITTYSYNDRGLEISRTEASDTPLARTTTTEWDPNRFLPTRVVDPTRTTVYSYDDQGRELSRQTTPIEQ